MTDQEILVLWVYAHETWPNLFVIPTRTDEQDVKLQVWRDCLADLDAGVVRRAIVAAGAEPFPPPPVALRHIAMTVQRREDGGVEPPTVDQAWSEVTAAIARVGRYRVPSWSHPAVGFVVKAIGWQEVCNNTDLGVLRGQFARLYDSARHRVEHEAESLPPLLAVAAAAGAIKRVDDVLDGGPRGVGSGSGA